MPVQLLQFIDSAFFRYDAAVLVPLQQLLPSQDSSTPRSTGQLGLVADSNMSSISATNQPTKKTSCQTISVPLPLPRSAFLEIAIFNAASAEIAYSAGADRLELCGEGSIAKGGTTPSLATVETVLDSLAAYQRTTLSSSSTSSQPVAGESHIPSPLSTIPPIYAMIRPRGGDFVYSDAEFETMKTQLQSLLKSKSKNAIPQHKPNQNNSKSSCAAGISGFVFGILTPDHKVDRVRNAELVRLVAPLPCTFHRAFDQVISAATATATATPTATTEGERASADNVDVYTAPFSFASMLTELEAVINAGFTSILTSGGQNQPAVAGAAQIAALTDAARDRIQIIAGGGVRSSNVRELRMRSPRTVYFHSSAIVVPSTRDDGDVADRDEVLALKKGLMAPLDL